MEIIAAFLLGIITSFVASFTGGGGAMVLVPALVGLGLSPITAIGTIKLDSIGFTLGSVANKKGHEYIQKQHLPPLFIIIILSSIIGPLFSLSLSSSSVKAISGAIIIFTSLVSLLSWKIASHSRSVSNFSKYLGYGLYFVSSTLLAGFTSGIGLLSNYILIGLVGMSPIETIATRRFLGLVGAPLQLIFYIAHGSVNYKFGFALAAGSIIGGYMGIHYAVKKGNDFIKKMMAITAIILVITIFI